MTILGQAAFFLAASLLLRFTRASIPGDLQIDLNEILSDDDAFLRIVQRRKEAEAEATVAVMEAVDNFIQGAMQCRKIPGLSIAIVKNGDIIKQKGYGFADIEHEVPYDADTQTCIGSCTKSFTAALIGILLDENKLRYPQKWDTRVKDVMGADFILGDSMRTDETTIRDLLAHRVGYPGYENTLRVGLSSGHTRMAYCKRLWTLKPESRLRTKFTYSNFMYMLSACVAERLGGDSYEMLMQSRVFGPLQMHSSSFVNTIENDDLPHSYLLNETTGRMERLDSAILRTVSPADAAGGLCTTAKDMAKWLQFHLSGGSVRHQNILSPELFQNLHEAQMFLEPDPLPIIKPYFPVSDQHTSYGLGWTLGSYRGYRYSRHGGTVSGFGSLVTIYHDLDIAIFTSINGPMSGGTINDVIHYYTTDLLLGLNPWLDDVTSCTFPSPWTMNLPSASSYSQRFRDRKRLSESGPARRLGAQRREERRQRLEKNAIINNHAKYTGQYGHLLFGNMTIAYDEPSSSLTIRVGEIGMGRLQYQSTVLWSIEFEGALSFLASNGSHQTLSPLLVFIDPIHGVFTKIQALGLEEKAPPIFYRNLQWTDPAPVDNDAPSELFP